jgi:hypothetical protein
MTETTEAKESIYACPVCGSDSLPWNTSRLDMVQCRHCLEVDDLKYFFKQKEK